MNGLFTIILLNYNQEKYIYEAIDSVLMQDYKKIELIISDDASSVFEKNQINNYIKKKNKNICVSFIVNSVNLGTVKSVNNAIKKARGEYVLIFAADDKLYDKKVISNFCDNFIKDENCNILTAQCQMCDNKLKNNNYNFVDYRKALIFNDMDSFSQFKCLAKSCLFAAGATSYRRSVFEKYGLPNEEYQLVEDLTYWLYLTRNGEKIKYVDFIALCHRDGGVSSATTLKKGLSNAVKLYYFDVLKMYELEIFPVIKKFSNKEKQKLYSNYLDIVLVLSSDNKKIFNDKKKYVLKLYFNDISYFLFKIFGVLKRNTKKIIYLIKKNFICLFENKNKLIMLMVWLLLNFLMLNIFHCNSLVIGLLFCNYFIAGFLTFLIKILYRWWSS